MTRLLGEEAKALLGSLEDEPDLGLRVNTLKVDVDGFEALSPWPLAPLPWCAEGFGLPAGSRPGLHPFHAAGLYYVQDPSAMAVVAALAPRPGELVLDLAAAPGGKSTHAAARLAGSGLLVSNDVEAGRARELSRNLERWGVSNAVVTSEPVARLAERWPGTFDAVILDAPCSGEGMFRKSSAAIEQWSEELVGACARTQAQLLPLAAQLVRPGGRLVYSTCTLGPEENEWVVADFLAAHPHWTALPHGLAGIDAGRPEWANGNAAADLRQAARLWPHRQPGEGHFLMLLGRKPEAAPAGATQGQAPAPAHAPTGPHRRARKASRASRSERSAGAGLQGARESWLDFVGRELTGDPLPGFGLLLRKDGLYALPPAAPDLEGLRVRRPGVWLGSPERSGFRPAHTLALSLRREQARRHLDLAPDGPELGAYLKGLELESAGEDGWLLVTIAGFPLGWGKRARGIVKNHYPKGLRLRG